MLNSASSSARTVSQLQTARPVRTCARGHLPFVRVQAREKEKKEKNEERENERRGDRREEGGEKRGERREK